MTQITSLFSSRTLSTLLWMGAAIAGLYIINRWQLGFFMLSVTLLFSWAAYALGTRGGREWRIPRSPVLGFAAAFWALVFASIFWSEMPLVSLSAFCLFSALPLTLFVFVLTADETQYRHIAFLSALVLSALAVWAVVQYCIGYNPFGGQAHHPLADPNALGGLFNLGFIPAIVWMMMAKTRAQSGMAMGLAALLFAGLLATGSRGAFLSLIPALAILIIFAWPSVRRHKRCLAGLALIAVVIFALSHFTGQYNWNTPVQRMSETVTLTKPDITNNRLNIWDGAVEVVKHHWLTGTGIGTFFLYYPEHRSPAEHIGVSHAHSDPLQYWAELGIAGVVLFYGFLGTVLVRTWKAVKRLPADDPQRLLILAPFCALGAVVIQTHVSFNFYNLIILFGAGFLIAAWFTATGRVLGDRMILSAFPEKMSEGTRQAVIALPFLPLLFLFLSYMMSEHYVNAARDSLFADHDLPGFAANLEKAHALDHGLNYRTWLLAANIPMGILQESGKGMSEDQQKELFQQAAGQLGRARALNPRSASVLYYQARLQELVPATLIPEGAAERETLYRQALALDPLHLGARIALSQIYEQKDDLPGARDILEGGINYSYTSTRALDYYARLLMLYLALGEQEKTQGVMDKIAAFRHRMTLSAKLDPRTGKTESLPVGRDDVAR